jgi:hypothetical protein
MKIDIPFHFLTVEVETHSQRLLDWLHILVENSHPNCNAFESKDCRYSLKIEEAGSPYQVPMERPTQAPFSGISLLDNPCFFHSGLFFAASSEPNQLVFTYNPETHIANVTLGVPYTDSLENFLHTFFSITSRSFLFPFYNLVTLHGAVAVKDEQVLFLYGPAGAGKTTTALSLLRQGYRILSDDSPLFTLDGSTAYALPSMDLFRVSSDGRNRSCRKAPALRIRFAIGVAAV